MIDVEARLIAAADFLRGAYSGLRPADLPSDLRPTSPAEAYRIQDLVIDCRGIAVWKIKATAASDNRTYAALATQSRLADGTVLPRGDRRPDLEVEVAVRIAADLPPRSAPYGRDELLAALGGAHAAFEIVESRFRDRKRASPLSTLALDRAHPRPHCVFARLSTVCIFREPFPSCRIQGERGRNDGLLTEGSSSCTSCSSSQLACSLAPPLLPRRRVTSPKLRPRRPTKR